MHKKLSVHIILYISIWVFFSPFTFIKKKLDANFKFYSTEYYTYKHLYIRY